MIESENFEKQYSSNQADQRTPIKSKAKLKAAQKVFLVWSQSVTYHCFPKIFKEKKRTLLRLLWAFTFLCLSSMTCLIIVQNIWLFYRFNVVSTIEIIKEKPTLFPAVTICQSSFLSSKEAENLIESILTENGRNRSEISYKYFKKHSSSLAGFLRRYVNDPSFGDSQRKLLGFNISDRIINCGFGETPELSKCTFADFHWFFHWLYGNCYQYNVGLNFSNERVDLKRQTEGGDYYGFFLEIGPLSSKNKYPMPVNSKSALASRGLKVFVHNQSFVPESFEGKFLSVTPGTETNIAISRIFSTSVPFPYSDCVDLSNGHGSELYNFMAVSNRTYRQRDCLELCYQKSINQMCHCNDGRYPMFSANYPVCLNITQILCSFQENEPVCDCPLECESVTYNVQTSSLDYPSREEYNLFKSDQEEFNATQSKYEIDLSSYDLYREYFYKINIFYATTEYTFISESPQMTLTGLLSNLGGSLGMFLGFSVFSILEIFELLFKVGYCVIFKKN